MRRRLKSWLNREEKKEIEKWRWIWPWKTNYRQLHLYLSYHYRKRAKPVTWPATRTPSQAGLTIAHLLSYRKCNLSTLCGLLVSRRCKRWTAIKSGQAGIQVLPGKATSSTTHRQKALLIYGIEKREPVGSKTQKLQPQSKAPETRIYDG